MSIVKRKTENILVNGSRLKCQALPDFYSDYNLDVCDFNQNPVPPGPYRLQAQFLITPDGSDDKFDIDFKVNNTNKEPAETNMPKEIGNGLLIMTVYVTVYIITS